MPPTTRSTAPASPGPKWRAGRAWAYLAAIQTIPGYEQAYIVSTGPKFGTRESRHLSGHYQVTEDDVLSGTRHDEVVALGAWPIE